MSLSKIVDELRQKNIMVNGLINYSGDYNGVYEIINGKLLQYGTEEYAIRKELQEKDVISKPLAEKIKAHIITLQNEHLSSPATLALEEMIKLIDAGME